MNPHFQISLLLFFSHRSVRSFILRLNLDLQLLRMNESHKLVIQLFDFHLYILLMNQGIKAFHEMDLCIQTLYQLLILLHRIEASLYIN